MKTNRELLNNLLKTTQMGQLGIRCVMDKVKRPGLRRAMESQLVEYDTIERQAITLAKSRGWKLEHVPNATKGMAAMMSRMRLVGGNEDSKIAGMLVQGNTRGMITGLKDLHQFAGSDGQIGALAQRLLDREQDNIRQASEFL